MSDTTVFKKPPEAEPTPAKRKYSDSAVREAYYKLLKDFHDPEKTLSLVSRTCHLSKEDVQHIVTSTPAPRRSDPNAPAVPAPKKIPRPEVVAGKDKPGRLIAPDPAAMLSFKHLALRETSEANATILAAVHVPGGEFIAGTQAMKSAGYKTLPPFDEQNEFQRAIVLYVARLLEVKAEQVCFGAKNVNVQGAEDRVGRSSSRGLPMDDEIFSPHVQPVRDSLAASHPGVTLHYISLPPMDLARLAHQSNSVVLAKPPETQGPKVELVTDRFLRARSRDLVFVDWVARRWPEGGMLDDVIKEIEYAEWLISLLSYTRYASNTVDGKRMLTKLACVCAARAQRWSPSPRLRQALAVAERWTEDLTEESRLEADQVKKDLGGPPPESEKPPEGPRAYAYQAAVEATLRAVSCAAATDAGRISSHCARAAAAAVMTASFAANAAKESSWIEMVSSHTAADETAEQRELCNAIRAVIYKH
ncbi:MAG: hypothetical protein KIS92_07740 [Planctomycetota bacterium]|nr:hypothetical protein [Planctomycetota bacterium]